MDHSDFRTVIATTAAGAPLERWMMNWVAQGAADGSLPDYQLSAWLMAVFCRGLSREALYWLTDAMASSGGRGRAQHSGRVDKHSTGGVGDKTTLVVAPLVASLGLPVAKLSGRGLGHTGGTLDKLESIPGFSVDVSAAALRELVDRVGVAVAAQTAELAPADGRLYALRDASATVESLPLIASSIMAKKIAGGAPALVLDVKVGSGGFMPTRAAAEDLARVMLDLARQAGMRARALLTDMSHPIGRAVGNALEVNEALDTLEGRGPDDFTELCVAVASAMLMVDGQSGDVVPRVKDALCSGLARAKFREWVRAQGGDTAWMDRPGHLPTAPLERVVAAPRSGHVERIHPRVVGEAALVLGAGRRVKTDRVDAGAGVLLLRQVGDEVTRGEPWAHLYGRREADLDQAARLIDTAFVLGSSPVARGPMVLADLVG